MMLIDWVISRTCSLTLLFIRCVVKPPLFCQIPLVFVAHSLTPTPVLLARMRTCRVSIWIVSTSATTDFGTQKASHYILDSEQWSMIEWWIWKACYSKQASGVLNILWRVMRCARRGEEGVLKVVEIVSMVGRQGKYIYGYGGVTWSGDIMLAANQLGGNLLSII